jgi:energy-converting hydrogenase B subunit Q
MADYAVLTAVNNQPGILFGLSKVLTDRQANITHVDIMDHLDHVDQRKPGDDRNLGHAIDAPDADIYLEFSCEQPLDAILDDLRRVPGVRGAEVTPSFSKIYGKRIIIMGGGAQVGQVALGAIAEADRHNIRGERISVDTIPLVGEDSLASAVRAVVRLPRVRLLVLAGSLMGGAIAKAVEEVRLKGLIVISLNMAGSVPDMADLVVSDPVQAGVMAVMAIADTAKFDIVRQQKRRY